MKYLVNVVKQEGRTIDLLSSRNLKKVGEPVVRAKRPKSANNFAWYPYAEFQKYKVSFPVILPKEPFTHFDEDKGIVYIEIKQTKEDMEENKLNLKPFDIQKAREGKPVCTRDGRKARIIYFDAKGDYPIVALIETGNCERVGQYMIDGHCTDIISQCCDDLMMLPDKKERWINVYKERCYESKEEAIRHIAPGTHYIDTIRLEWEE